MRTRWYVVNVHVGLPQVPMAAHANDKRPPTCARCEGRRDKNEDDDKQFNTLWSGLEAL